MILVSKYPTETEFSEAKPELEPDFLKNYSTQNQQPNVLFMCGPQNGN
jgi:uncharacterized protein YciI